MAYGQEGFMDVDSISTELGMLVQKSEELLGDTGTCYADVDREALADMVQKARAALKGKDVPFTRNREFMHPDKGDRLLFAYDRFTMVPTFFEEGKAYSHYGLKKAVAWFQEQDMSRYTKEQLADRKHEVMERGRELLDSATYGDGIGQYDREKGMALRKYLEHLEKVSWEELPWSIADCVNAMWEFRFSMKLRSEADTESMLLFSEKKCQEISRMIGQKSLVGEQYREIRKIADRTSVEENRIAYEQIWEKHSYEELNRWFSIWGDTGKMINLTTPRGTVAARISLCLPEEENESQGLGHIMVTDLHLYSADGPEAVIPNACFADSEDWPQKGSLQEKEGQNAMDAPKIRIGQDEISVCPAGHWLTDFCTGTPVCGCVTLKDGQSCLYLGNPTVSDCAKVVCDREIRLKENACYTLFFRAKQDGKFKTGLKVVLEFLDCEGSIIGQFVYRYNRKSMPVEGRRALDMQCNAIVYAMEGKQEYALKAKREMLAFLNDFCQGAEYWMTYNGRPEGCDAYGAVQSGRIMGSVASAWSLIRNAGVFTEEEKRFLYGMVDYLLHYCLDMRDRMTLAGEKAQQGSSNWQTDMCIGVAMLMMALPDYPNRKIWLYNAEALLRAQLKANLNQDGSWPESIRYHHAALEHFATFAAVWKMETGEDWLTTTRLKEMFAYTIHTITPPYVYFGNRVGTPPFGDHRLGGGTELGIYGLYVERIAGVDRQLADKMYQVWKLAGCPVKGFSGESLAVENLLYAEPDEYSFLEENLLKLMSTVSYPDSGIYVFRQGIRESFRDHNQDGSSMKRREQSQSRGHGENYLAVMAAKKPVGHGHLDQGSFILYYQNYPVVMDSGIEGYFDASTQWHQCSYSHACLQFAATAEEQKIYRKDNKVINLNAGNYSLDRGWWDVPHICRVLDVKTEEDSGEYCPQEEICMEITHPLGAEKGVHERRILFEKRTGIVTIEDKIRNYRGKVLFSLPLVMRRAEIEGCIVRGEGYYSVGVEVEFLTLPDGLLIEKGRTTPMFPTEDAPMLLYVRASMDASEEIRVRIKPNWQEKQ